MGSFRGMNNHYYCRKFPDCRQIVVDRNVRLITVKEVEITGAERGLM